MIAIGIDPGVNTGLAVWDADAQRFAEVTTTTIVAAMDIVLHYTRQGREVTLYAEDARQRKWIPREASLSQFKGRAMGAGSVKRDCSIWEEFAKHHVLPLVLVPPRKGMTKWTADYFKAVTGWTGRTSDHARDAAMLVFGRKNNPENPKKGFPCYPLSVVADMLAKSPARPVEFVPGEAAPMSFTPYRGNDKNEK